MLKVFFSHLCSQYFKFKSSENSPLKTFHLQKSNKYPKGRKATFSKAFSIKLLIVVSETREIGSLSVYSSLFFQFYFLNQKFSIKIENHEIFKSLTVLRCKKLSSKKTY